ncbi:hypothetical protein BB558_004475 [Smittium angustum]|uniref:Protein ARV n=1 Tax=Smittium angustum TaxID=133377 RepID=A0A2U1J365_SMIAN|nr:hypothetical protein BB558_004475 [Smittium angustum]
MDLIASTMEYLGNPIHVLICTYPLDVRLWKPIQCSIMGCECHALEDPSYTFLFPLMMLWAITAVALAFAPKAIPSPLETILLRVDDSEDESTNKNGVEKDRNTESTNKNLNKYVCIECGTPTSSLYTEYSKGNIRLTQCEKCHSFVDKYVEHDVIIIFIDTILYNPQVYRHLLVNKKNFRRKNLEKDVIKIAVLLILFNVYISWFRLEEGGRVRGQEGLIFGYKDHFFYQYLCILFLCIIEFFSYIAGVVAALVIIQRSFALAERWSNIATAIIVSSFGRILMIFLVIWKYQEPFYSILLDALTYTSHSTALAVLFGLSTKWAAIAVIFGLSCKQLVSYFIINTAWKFLHL